MRRLLAQRDARLFLAGQSLSLLGDTALWLALGLWAKDLTGSSSAAGLVFLCIVAPQLAAPFAGLLVDRVRRRSLLLAVNPLTALAVLPLLTVHDAHDVWIIYAVALAYGASYTLLAAGQSALLHTLLEPDLLGPANAALQTVREALRLVAPVAGAGLYALAGGAAVALLDAATFLAATVALLALKLREPKPTRDPEPRAIVAGARHVRAIAPLRQMVAACALCMLVIGFSETLLFELPHALGKPDSFVGVLMAVQGVGAIAGALTATRAIARHGELRRRRLRDDDLRARLPVDGRQHARGRLRRQAAVRPRPAVDRGRDAHPAAAQHAFAPAGPGVRRLRARARDPADAVDRARGGAGGPDRLSLCTAGPSLHGRCRGGLAAD